MKNQKISIIAEGGGMRGAYALGAIDALYSHFGMKKADIVTGSSSGVGTLAYYTAGQFYPGFHIWPEELPKWRFLSKRNLLLGKPFLNVDYLVDNIFQDKRWPINPEKVFKSEIKLIIPLANAETGKTKYFSNKNKFEGNDLYKILKASMALPFAYGKYIKLNDGNSYFDGAQGDPLPIRHHEIKDTRKIIILTKDIDYPINLSWQERLFIELMKPTLKPGAYKQLKTNKEFYKKRLEQISTLETQGDIVIRPSSRLPRLDNSRQSIEDSISKGKSDAISHKGLVELMRELKSSSRYKFYFEK